MNKKIRKKADFYLSVILVLGILAAVNYLSYQLFCRWDLSQNKEYSISEVSKRAVRNLDDVVLMKLYFSKDLPSRFLAVRQNILDLLGEYESYSRGRVKIEVIDPKDDDNLKRRLQNLGIPLLQFQEFAQDKSQLVNGYMGMAMEYRDKVEVIPVISSTRNLEYEVTRAIKKLTIEEPIKIGWTTSHGTISPEEARQLLRRLRDIYTVEEVDLGDSDLSGLHTLIIAGPSEKFSEEELKKIDKFVVEGGNLLVLYDGIRVGDMLTPIENRTGLEELLEKYGIKVSNDLVLEPRLAGMASFSQGFWSFSTPYAFWPKIIKSGFSSDYAAVAGLESVILPWASTIEALEKVQGEGFKVTAFMHTSAQSLRQTSNFDLSPKMTFSSYGGEKGEWTVGIDVAGKFHSPYGLENSRGSRIVVVGDSNFISGQFASMGDNLNLFLNLVDSLSLDEDLINVRSRGITDRPLKELTDSRRALVKYLNIFGMTALVLAFGLGRYFWRRRRRLMDEL